MTLGFPPAVGGIQRLLHERCLMQPDGVAVLAPRLAGSDDFDAAQPFPIRRWSAWTARTPGVRRLFQFALPLWDALRWRAVQPIQHIECGQTLPFGLAAWLLGKRWGVPYDVWAFGDDVLKAARHPLLRPLARFVLTRARRIWAVSHATWRVVLALGVADDVVRVVHPWPATCFTPVVKGGAVARDPATLLTVARLERRKGVQSVLRAFAQVHQAAPRTKLIIVGDGPYRAALERLAAALRLTDAAGSAVHFTGRATDEALAAWYRQATLFLFAPEPEARRGEMEGFGLVCAEASACGCPVVAWDTGGVAEAVRDGETGLVVPYGDVEALARAALRLLASPDEAARLGQDGLRYAALLRQKAAATFRETMQP